MSRSFRLAACFMTFSRREIVAALLQHLDQGLRDGVAVDGEA